MPPPRRRRQKPLERASVKVQGRRDERNFTTSDSDRTDAEGVAHLTVDDPGAHLLLTVDPPEGRDAEWAGEAKVAGHAVVRESPDESHRFAMDISEVVLTHLDEAGTQLVIESWHPGSGLREVRRS